MADYKYIELSDGSLTKVDESDYPYLNKWKWNNVGGYAARHMYPKGLKGASYIVLMHRVVLACPDKLLVDHINHDKLDNTGDNLRVATKSQNQWNRLVSKNNTSGYTGITWDKVNSCWKSSAKIGSKYKTLGRFKTIEEAVDVRNRTIDKFRGEFSGVA